MSVKYLFNVLRDCIKINLLYYDVFIVLKYVYCNKMKIYGSRRFFTVPELKSPNFDIINL